MSIFIIIIFLLIINWIDIKIGLEKQENDVYLAFR